MSDGSAIIAALVVDSRFCTEVLAKHLVARLGAAVGVGRLHVERFRGSIEMLLQCQWAELLLEDAAGWKGIARVHV